MIESITSWDDLDLDTNILRGIYSYGFETPSPIQSRAIRPIMNGQNVIAQAQSGTGKTATFSIGALSITDVSLNSEQIIIIAPTRELSKQIYDVLTSIGRFVTGLQTRVLIGGISLRQDLMSLKRTRPHIIIGCPGRIMDCIHHQGIRLRDLKLVVMDEADELLSSGFTDQIHSIVSNIPTDTRIALFSATLPDSVRPIVAQLFTTPPIEILVKQEELTLEGIKQYYVAIEDEEQKYETLKDLYKTMSISQCIIYCNSIRRVIVLYNQLVENGFAVSCIHGDMDKPDRDRSFTEFKSGSSRILISSNITARGIDIQQVSIVINYDIPSDVSSYLHRIGRSGRWGRKGTGINFVTKFDVNRIRDIEKYYDTEIVEMPHPEEWSIR
jgi:translation initiation factor 4A